MNLVLLLNFYLFLEIRGYSFIGENINILISYEFYNIFYT